MRQKIRVTRTISTSVEEKDWKSCCPTCVMQVPPPLPPAPGPRALALPLPLALGEAKVRLRRHGGSASLSSLGALALIGAGLGGAGPTRLPLLGNRSHQERRGRAHATQNYSLVREGMHARAKDGESNRGQASRPGSERCPGDPLWPRLERVSARPFPLPRHQAAKRTGLVRIPAAAQGSAEDRKDQPLPQSGPLGILPRPGAASLLRSPGTPTRPPLAAHPSRQLSRSRHSRGRGLRRHRGETDYSADKAAFLGPPQLSNCNRHTAAWERGPRFPEDRLASFLRPLSGCLPVHPTLPSTHPQAPNKRAPGAQYCLLFPSLPLQTPLPWPASGPLSPIPKGTPQQPHPTPPLSVTTADALDHAPSILQSSSRYPRPPNQKKKSS